MQFIHTDSNMSDGCVVKIRQDLNGSDEYYDTSPLIVTNADADALLKVHAAGSNKGVESLYGFTQGPSGVRDYCCSGTPTTDDPVGSTARDTSGGHLYFKTATGTNGWTLIV
jgi:hypothetical protein